MTEGFKVVIPARYASSRLPGKPLLDIAGKPMIAHVIERACASGADEVLVATDDERIAAACVHTAATPVLTSPDHHSGTERIAEVAERRGWTDDVIVVNLQGDEPCIPPEYPAQVARDLAADSGIGMSTLAWPIEDAETLFDPNAVKVVCDGNRHALYFSRAPIPWVRGQFGQGVPPREMSLPQDVTFLRHIGLYAYRVAFLRRYVGWEPSPLEQIESLEQLRVLWHGEGIHVGVATQPPGMGVDTLQDLERVRAFVVGTASD